MSKEEFEQKSGVQEPALGIKKAALLCNINVGILGHVDSGKTSLVKALSTSLSTAALDKNPQSQQRGITLDLGFSSFVLPIPEQLRDALIQYDALQFTLVDCPGHASLIKTIIGGAQIIDMVILVVDANKGIQTQTAECIVIAEITTNNLIIVLNKIDVIPEEERERKLDEVVRRIRKTFNLTKFKDVPIVCTSATVGGEKVAAVTGKSLNGALDSDHQDEKNIGIDILMNAMRDNVRLPKRDIHLPFYFAIDHCFPIKGHGTILTGTVLSGCVATNQTIEMPYIQEQRKVKSMQMFHKSVKSAKQGDRVGICVTNLDSTKIERGIAAAPGSVPLLQSALCLVKKIRFFKGDCKSNTKYHISIGHTTIIATVTFFGAKEFERDTTSFAPKAESAKQNLNVSHCEGFPRLTFDWSKQFEAQDSLVGENSSLDDEDSTPSLTFGNEALQWACLRFQQPVYCPIGSLVIGSRLDTDTSEDSSGSKMCRLAFYGPIVEIVREDEICSNSFDKISIFTQKQKQAEIFKLTDVRAGGMCFELIAHKLFGEGGSLTPFLGLKIKTRRGQIGTITSAFGGAGGKFKIKFDNGIPRSNIPVGSLMYLPFKRISGDKEKRMVQFGTDLDSDICPVFDDAAEIQRLSVQSTEVEVPEVIISGVPIRRIKQNKKVNDSVSVVSTLPPDLLLKRSEIRRGFAESLKDPIPVESGPKLFSMVIVAGAFRMEENIREFAGSVVLGPDGQVGELIGPFAKMGKCKVYFKHGLSGPEGCKIEIRVNK
jgi:selenocysteine-specific elongation factor